jgi:hypothetical protein
MILVFLKHRSAYRHRASTQMVGFPSLGWADEATRVHPRLVLVQDTIWIQCGFADIAKTSDLCNSSPSRDSAAQKTERGEGYDEHSGLPRLSRDRDRWRARRRGRTLSGRRLIYIS